MSGVEAIAHALAGSTGGIVAMTLLYPLENIRTRLQVQVQRKSNAPNDNTTAAANPPVTGSRVADANEVREPEECISPETPHQQQQQRSAITSLSSSSSPPIKSSSPSPSAPYQYEFHGALDCVRQVCEREGWQKLYSGLPSALIGVGASSAVYFFWYYTFKAIVLSHTNSRTMGPIANLLVASTAGVLNVFMTLPIWHVNTRMAIHHEYDGVWDAICKIYAEEGISSFYHSLVPSLILVSNPAIQFFVYEQTIALYTRAARKAMIHAATTAASSSQAVATATAAASSAPIRLSSLQYFLLGAFAKAVATVATYPYQVVKSRLQASRTLQQSTWSTVKTMLKEEGISSFWNGMNAKMTQTVLNSAFMFAVYERLVRWILAFIKWLQTEYRSLPKPL